MPNTTQNTTLLDLYETKTRLERKLFKKQFMEFARLQHARNFYARVNGETPLTAPEAVFIAEWFNVKLKSLLTEQQVKAIDRIPVIREESTSDYQKKPQDTVILTINRK